jgi:hypothetical protein
MPNFGNPMLLAWQWFIRASCLEERSERRAFSSNTSFRLWSYCIKFSGFWLPLISFSLRFLGFGPAKRAALRPLPTTEILIQLKIMTYSQSRKFFWVHPQSHWWWWCWSSWKTAASPFCYPSPSSWTQQTTLFRVRHRPIIKGSKINCWEITVSSQEREYFIGLPFLLASGR